MRIVVLMTLLLAGCAGGQTVEPQIVNVPVIVPCIKAAPQRPAYRFDVLPAPKTDAEAADQVRVLWADREAADLYGRSWEAAAAGCLINAPAVPRL